MRSRRNFTQQEKEYIINNYKKYKLKEIAKKLNRNTNVIKNFLYNNKISKQKEKIQIGDKFTYLTVKSKIDKKTNFGGYLWLCECRCGKQINTTTNCLLSGHTKSCGCLRIEVISSGLEYISGTWYRSIKDNAIKRNLDFKVSLEFLNDLLKRQNFKCAVSGLPIKIMLGRKNKQTTASLDRIDNTLPYIEGNVQFVHKHINYMKWTHQQDYFIKLCKIITEYQETKRD